MVLRGVAMDVHQGLSSRPELISVGEGRGREDGGGASRGRE